MSFPNLKQKLSPSEDSNSFEPFMISKISLIVHRRYRFCANFLTLLKVPTYTFCFLSGIVYEISGWFKNANTLSTSSSLSKYLFLFNFSPNLTRIWYFDANLVITSLFLLGLFRRVFSAFLTLLDLIAALLKKVEWPKDSSDCWW